MKKIIVLLLSLSVITFCTGQVLINYQLPATGTYLKSQLWNFSVVNSGSTNINVRFNISFTDAVNGQRVFTASSGIYTLSQQVTQLQASSLTPIIYNMVNTAYHIDMGPDGFLPVGQFEVCIEAVQINNDLATKIGEDCANIEVEPASPPVLITPAADEIIYEKRPFFSWVPPVPASSFNNLDYTFLMVSIQGLQSAGDALQQNIPVYAQQGIKTTSFLYPPGLSPLDTSVIYAWQVSATSSGNSIVKSDIFMFKVAEYSADTSKVIQAEFYSPLKRENDASYTIAGNSIRFEYLNETNDSVATINISDISGRDKSVVQLSSVVKLKFGQNFIRHDISALSGLISKHVYLLELTNSKEEHWFLKFEYRKTD